MNRQMKALWTELALEGTCPELNVKRVTRQVNAKLNADPSERKLYMKQKLRFAAVLTAAVIALCGTAFAVVQNIDVLTAWFEGDTAAAENLVDREVRSDSDGRYTLVVDSSISDGDQVYILARVEAETPEAVEFLMSDDFGGHMSPFQIDSIVPPVPEGTSVPAEGGVSVPGGGGNITVGGISIASNEVYEMKEALTETSRTWAIASSLGANATVARVRLWATEDDFGSKDCPTVEVPLAPAESIDLMPMAEGQGYGTFTHIAGGPVTLARVHITPFSMTFTTFFSSSDEGAYPAPLLRMADGSLCTPNQLGTPGRLGGKISAEGGYHGTWTFRFRSVMDLDRITGVAAFGREYPVDGGASRPVEVDPRLLPFTLPFLGEPDEQYGYRFSVRALCDGLGASCKWDGETQAATLSYRGVEVVLTPGSDTVLVDGVPTVMPGCAPRNVDGKLAACADSHFLNAWGIGMSAAYSDGIHTQRVAWLVNP